MMAISGALLLGACSSDDENLESQKVTPLSPLETVANDLNKNMKGLDFKDLNPLAEVINSKTRGDSEDSEFEVTKKRGWRWGVGSRIMTLTRPSNWPTTCRPSSRKTARAVRRGSD